MADHENDGGIPYDPARHEACAADALAALEASRVALRRQLLKLKAMEPTEGDPDRLSKLQADVARALSRAAELEDKAHDARCKRDRGGGIDLGAAAAEVRRRLARLRGAGGGGPPSGGTE
ncbi:hypothetical protein [Jannaschia sp. W003]|uniref:hypothetical protein n=1 Tax=Jannaschia sp. W003 TaxID=2867012 RepID=UPI0021A3DC1B|nr:hypothetical protein [Jannaschia sp. W003]UWQ21012.1 hypothetical protein K3554_13700 [Jannaschia sp. W003]